MLSLLTMLGLSLMGDNLWVMITTCLREALPEGQEAGPFPHQFPSLIHRGLLQEE